MAIWGMHDNNKACFVNLFIILPSLDILHGDTVCCATTVYRTDSINGV